LSTNKNSHRNSLSLLPPLRTPPPALILDLLDRRRRARRIRAHALHALALGIVPLHLAFNPQMSRITAKLKRIALERINAPIQIRRRAVEVEVGEITPAGAQIRGPREVILILNKRIQIQIILPRLAEATRRVPKVFIFIEAWNLAARTQGLQALLQGLDARVLLIGHVLQHLELFLRGLVLREVAHEALHFGRVGVGEGVVGGGGRGVAGHHGEHVCALLRGEGHGAVLRLVVGECGGEVELRDVGSGTGVGSGVGVGVLDGGHDGVVVGEGRCVGRGFDFEWGGEGWVPSLCRAHGGRLPLW
jgi:hypothetical protein